MNNIMDRKVKIAGQAVTVGSLFARIDHGEVTRIEPPPRGSFYRVTFADGFTVLTKTPDRYSA